MELSRNVIGVYHIASSQCAMMVADDFTKNYLRADNTHWDMHIDYCIADIEHYLV